MIDDRYHAGNCAKVPKVVWKVPGGQFYQYAEPGTGERVGYGSALPPAPCNCGFDELVAKQFSPEESQFVLHVLHDRKVEYTELRMAIPELLTSAYEKLK